MHPNHFAINWYEKQRQQKEDQYQKNQIANLNRQLQEILHQVERVIDKSKYEKQVQHLNRMLFSTHTWNIGYLNDRERPEIVVEQGVLISLILHVEKDLEGKGYLQDKLQRLMGQFRNIDYGLFGDFNRRVHMLKGALKEEKEIKRAY